MKRRARLWAALAGFLLCALAPSAFAQSGRAAVAQREIQKAADRWGKDLLAILESGDLAGLAPAAERAMTPDVVSVWVDGTGYRNRAQGVSIFTSFVAQMKKLHRYDLRVEKTRLLGPGRAASLVHFDISYDNVDTRTGRTHRITNRGIEDSIHVKTPQGWKLQRSRGLVDRYFTDGILDTPERIARREIQALYDLYLPTCRKAIESRNFDAFRAYLEANTTADYVIVGAAGARRNKAQDLKVWVDSVRNMQSLERCDLKIETLRLEGKDTVVVVVSIDEASVDRAGQRGTRRARERQTWVRRPSGWKLRSVRVIVPDDPDRAALQAHIADLDRAILSNDRQRVAPFFAPDGVFVTSDGRVLTRDAFVAQIALPGRRFRSAHSASDAIRFFGDTVIETGVFTADGIDAGKPFHWWNRYLATWVKREGSWQVVAEQDLDLPNQPGKFAGRMLPGAVGDREARAAIRERIADLDRALAAADRDALYDLYDPRGVFVSEGKVKDRTALLADLLSGKLVYRTPKSMPDNLRVFGDTAIESGIFTAKGTLNGRSVSVRIRYTATWVLREGKWAVVSGQDLNLPAGK